MRVLVLFDFDGTLSKRDSFIPFLLYVKGPAKLIFGLISLLPAIAVYLLTFRDNHWLKSQFITAFLKNYSTSELYDWGRKFYMDKLQKMLRAEAIQALKLHLSAGHDCAVVSASAEYWLKPFCEQYGTRLICSRWELQNGRVSGKLKGRNNYGAEKAKRIRETYRLADYDLIVAYGDSKGDREMLELAQRRHYRQFNVTAEDGI